MSATRRAPAAAAKPAEGTAPANNGPRVLKKYPNRRLYDTHASSYITLADVKQMVLENIDFIVVDAKSGDDLTRASDSRRSESSRSASKEKLPRCRDPTAGQSSAMRPSLASCSRFAA